MAALACLLLLALAAWAPGSARAADSIYWANFGNNLIRAGNLDGTGASTLFAEPGGSSPQGITIDPAANRIYWANGGTNEIRAGNLDGTGTPTTLFTEAGGTAPGAVAIDPAAKKIYWVSFGTPDAIRVGNSDGTGTASTLYAETPGSDPAVVAIDPAAGRIYWTNAGPNTVRVGNLDGSGASTLFAEPGGSFTNGIAVDATANRIHWANSSSDQIRAGSLNGSGAQTLFTEAAGSIPVGLAIDPASNRIYWGNQGPDQIRVGNLDGTGAPSTLFTEPGGSGPITPALLRSPVADGPPVVSRVNANTLARKGKKRFKPGQLTCSRGTWAPDLLGAFLYRAPRSFAFQWQRNGTDIAGATTSTLTPKKRGRYSCRVTATNHAGSATQSSARKCAKRKKPLGPGKGKKKKCRVQPKKKGR